VPSTAFDTAANTQAAPSGAVGGAAFVPGVDRDMGPNRAPRLTKRPPFLYFAHPERWQIIDGNILPLLGKLKLQPGVMGVQRGRAPGAVNLRLARVACEERGRTIIPVDSVPPAHVAPGEAPSYLRTIDSTSGPVVLSRYEMAFAGSAATKCDAKSWAEFLRHQIDAGVVEPAPTWVLERMRDSRAKSLERMESNQSTNRAKRERLQAEVDVLDAMIAERMEVAAPVVGTSAMPSVEG